MFACFISAHACHANLFTLCWRNVHLTSPKLLPPHSLSKPCKLSHGYVTDYIIINCSCCYQHQECHLDYDRLYSSVMTNQSSCRLKHSKEPNPVSGDILTPSPLVNPQTNMELNFAPLALPATSVNEIIYWDFSQADRHCVAGYQSRLI